MKEAKGRSYKVILTNEGQVLKQLRLKHKLSMREAGVRVGVSDSYISLIQNGRTDPPRADSLARFLKVYGGISEKYFLNWFVSTKLRKLMSKSHKTINSLSSDDVHGPPPKYTASRRFLGRR